MQEESLRHTCKIQDNFIDMFVCPLFKEESTGKVFGK